MRLRRPLIALPTISSDAPWEYTLAVSTRVTPASSARSIWRPAACTSSSPTMANFPAPPKPIVPRPNTETRSPERPSCRCSMKVKLAGRDAGTRADGQDHCGGDQGQCADYVEAELVARHVRRG